MQEKVSRINKIMEEIRNSAQNLSFRDETGRQAVALEELNAVLDKYVRKEDITSMPYIRGRYNRSYGDTKLCTCGHIYEGHFDSYYNMSPCGCKYCGCHRFIPAEETVKGGVDNGR